MKFSFLCENPNCKWEGQTRTVTMPTIYPGLYDTPLPICECGMYPRPVRVPA
jgi:hypothetical protein